MDHDSFISKHLTLLRLCVFVFFRWSEEQAITYSRTSPMTSTRQSFRSSLGRRRKATKREQSSEILLIQMTHRRAQGLTNPDPEHRHNSLSLFIMHFTLKRDPSLTEDTLLIIPQCNALKGLGSNIRWCHWPYVKWFCNKCEMQSVSYNLYYSALGHLLSAKMRNHLSREYLVWVEISSKYKRCSSSDPSPALWEILGWNK